MLRPNQVLTKNGFLGRAVAVFTAAGAASSRVDARRRPEASDLLVLGIDPSTFPDINRI
ncbi:hypothetical protein G6L37_04570 [Agrobacterium rubi]|nr:hypothetical protein [Agrobacterium rubi]NTF24627.1 hypothetical protein [Agrobacterium rubi]